MTSRASARVLPAASPAAVDEAEALLREGRVVALPTDTVYGVAVDPWQRGATDRLYVAKARPKAIDVPVLVADAGELDALVVDVPAAARELAIRFWPGPLTLVLGRRADLAHLDLGGDGDGSTIGVRCPDHDLVRELASRLGPLAVTSANRHGEPTPETAAAVAAAGLTGVELVLDGGPCAGAPSTVVAVIHGDLRVLREGRIPADAIRRGR